MTPDQYELECEQIVDQLERSVVPSRMLISRNTLDKVARATLFGAVAVSAALMAKYAPFPVNPSSIGRIKTDPDIVAGAIVLFAGVSMFGGQDKPGSKWQALRNTIVDAFDRGLALFKVGQVAPAQEQADELVSQHPRLRTVIDQWRADRGQPELAKHEMQALSDAAQSLSQLRQSRQDTLPAPSVAQRPSLG